ncbi:DNA-3-methyladenine glycosylase family protein [Flavobacterium hauense]
MDTTIPLLIEKDNIFSTIIDKYGLPQFIMRSPGFESLSKTILEQQVSLDSAKASFNKLKTLIVDFTPENCIEVSEQEFRECGISRQKTAYLRGLAEAVIDKRIDIEGLAQKHPDEVRRELIQLKGIGNWTVDVYLMFSLQSPDILPLGDIGILSAIRDLWGLTDMNEVIAHTEHWKPYRTTAAFFLWHYYLEKRGRKFPH